MMGNPNGMIREGERRELAILSEGLKLGPGFRTSAIKAFKKQDQYGAKHNCGNNKM